MPKTTIQPNQKFGRLTVVALDQDTPRTHRKYLWKCRCECGGIKSVCTNALVSGAVQSCGCLYRETRGLSKTHGMWGSPEHVAWHNMKQRVRPDVKQYAKTYLGITVHPTWERFEAFYADVGPMPSPEHTLDRIDGTKGYEPGNVRWATYAEQNRNTSRNVWITFQGVTLCRADWARKLGINYTGLKWRLEHWTLERALTTSVPRKS